MHMNVFLVCVFTIILTAVFCDDDDERRRRFCEHSDPYKILNCLLHKGKSVVTVVADGCTASVKPGLNDLLEKKQFICHDATDEQMITYMTCIKAGMATAKTYDPELQTVVKECLQ